MAVASKSHSRFAQNLVISDGASPQKYQISLRLSNSSAAIVPVHAIVRSCHAEPFAGAALRD